jgi:hypothetical protein
MGTQIVRDMFPLEWRMDCCFRLAIPMPEYQLVIHNERVVAVRVYLRPVLWKEEPTTTGKGKRRKL